MPSLAMPGGSATVDGGRSILRFWDVLRALQQKGPLADELLTPAAAPDPFSTPILPDLLRYRERAEGWIRQGRHVRGVKHKMRSARL